MDIDLGAPKNPHAPVMRRLSARQWLAAKAIVLADVVASWQERVRQRRILLSLDARMLKDIGVTQADARWEGNKPFWRG